MSSIEQFMANFQKGFYKSNLYRVRFVSFPAALSAKWLGDLEKISLLCSSAELPNVTITDAKSVYDNRQHAVGMYKDYDSIGLKFILDQDMIALCFIEDWLNTIINGDTNLLNYKQDYEGDIEIECLDSGGNRTCVYTLYSVFPINKDSVSLGYTNGDQIAELGVKFSFDKYVMSGPKGTVVGQISTAMQLVAPFTDMAGSAVSMANKAKSAISNFRLF